RRGVKSLVRTRGLIDSVSYGHEAIVRRLGRVAFMVVGAAIGVGSFVIATGLSTTVRAQVSSEFDIRLATQVVAHEAGSSAALTLFEDVPEAVTSLPGVEAAALVAAGAIDLSPLPPLLSRSQPAIAVAATANFLEAVEVD